MRRTTSSLFRTPQTGAGPALDAFVDSGGNVAYGVLRGLDPNFHVPICSGFALFSESVTGATNLTLDDLRDIEHRLLADQANRFPLSAHKEWREDCDRQLACLPFQAGAAQFIEVVAASIDRLPRGDTIVILGCRSGWFAEAIAARCPENLCVSMMDPDDPILGFTGCRMWLDNGHRARNLDIVFQRPGHPLPFKTDIAGAIIDLRPIDTTIPWTEFVREALGLCRADGFMAVLPIPNMGDASACDDANKTKNPTDIGGVPAIENVAHIAGFRIAQPDAGSIDAPSYPTTSSPGTQRHKPIDGPLILIGSKYRHNVRTSIDQEHRLGVDQYMLVNPRWHLNLHRQTATRDAEPYRPMALKTEHCEILYWASRAVPVSRIPAATQYDHERCVRIADELTRNDLLRVSDISDGMARLHCFRMNGECFSPYAERIVAAIPRDYFEAHGDAPFITAADTGEVLSYAEMRVATNLYAKALHRAGVRQGHRVCVQSSLGVPTLLLFWAAVQSGAVFVPFDGTWARSDIEQVLADCAPQMVFADVDAAMEIDPKSPGLVVVADTQSSDANFDRPGWYDLDQFMVDSAGQPSAPDITIEPGDPALILPTSGTTGRRKLVQLSQGALFRIAQTNSAAFRLTPDDRILNLAGFHAIAGIRVSMAGALTGSCQVLVSTVKEGLLLQAVQICADYRVTVLSLNPNSLRAICHSKSLVERIDLNSLRLVCSGGDRLPANLVAELREFIDVDIHESFGATEAPTVIEADASGDGVLFDRGGQPQSVIAQVIRDDCKLCATNEVGTLRIYTDRQMDGYVDQPELTAAALRGRWLHIGDLALWNDDDRIQIVGREREIYKDMQGEVIFPSELETVLIQHEAVSDAAASSFRNRNGIEVGVAFVQLDNRAGPSEHLTHELKQLIRDLLGPHKVPARMIIVDEFPRNDYQKILKSKLLDDHAVMLRSASPSVARIDDLESACVAQVDDPDIEHDH